MEGMHPAITIIITCITSSALLAFIQFLITRHDNKNGVFKELRESIAENSKQMQNLKKHVDDSNNQLVSYIEEHQMIECRIRILRASDEMRREVKHSEEFFDQINDDISQYNRYCQTHPGFKNNKAIHAINNIDRVYADCIKNNTFL